MPEMAEHMKNLNRLKKGKTYEEIYGIERAKLEREKRGKSISKTHRKDFNSGKRIVWNKNLTKKTDKRVKKYANNLVGKRRKDMEGDKNLMNNIKIKEKCLKGIKEFWIIKGDIHKKIMRKKYWDNPIWIEKHKSIIIPRLKRRPTSYEKKISELCIEHNLPFIYTGDGKFLIGYKNPDFRHKYFPILIEVYNDYHHPNNYEEIRGEHFIKYGYKTIFINEEEVTDKNWEKICLNKIKNSLK